MKKYMKSYSLSLKTASPLFIGDGKSLNKKEYIYLRNQKKVLVPDIGKLYEGIWQKRLSRQFTDYLLDGNDRSGLEQWLRNNRIGPADYEKWTWYSLDGGDHLGEGKRPIEIATFIKDGYGLPYIPGTSIKGVLRNLLLIYEINRNPEICRSVKRSLPGSLQQTGSRKAYLKRDIEQIETTILHTLNRIDKNGKELRKEDAVNDVLSGLIVSDSQPLKWTNMILCQKMDRSPNGTVNNNLNILREAVKPGIVIPFQLTIDTTLCPYTIEDIQEAVKVFNDLYYSMYLEYFSDTDRPADDIIWLGGGAGFLTKTILYPLLGHDEGLKAAIDVFDHTLPRSVNERHKHYKDHQAKVSPHMLKCTEYKGKMYQMGQCHLIVHSGGTV